jgi:hypothetical protein
MSGMGVECNLRRAGASTNPDQMARRRTQGVLNPVTVKAMRKAAIVVGMEV